ncbi:phosphate acyltransferase PlsX [Lentilactobacillus sp. SPB1-3]|uniref:Phosphate acyltransferase PlsX n=1 Tax=Lentilactobacillus terminaliae TaxID=3003483 RepID=A0ACD5DCP1_9LACO|nr:phosphate acyltransferase PlsX [Lentilactobacillus sp. SPB1-3]MCZ0977178.1 phosphate acyltransferase PlsX [Lentilactobacillus sp. SPB1-3]
MKIAIDAMGGDYAPKEIVAGVELSRDENPDIQYELFGITDEIKKYLKNDQNIVITQADEVIEMGEEPVRAIRKKKQSSLVLAAQSVSDGKNDAFFSAGNTGAVLAAGLFIIGRIKGIDRPGLTTTLPIVNGKPGMSDKFLMLDVGANADSKPLNLYQFAFMGKYYAQNVLNIENPRVGLLNNGTEPDKGDMLHKEVHELLAANKDLNFIGNVESRELLNGAADVVVTDGFTGNAALKSIEGTALSMLRLIKHGITDGGLRDKMGALLLKNVFGSIADQMDYSKYGGAMFLGLKAPVIKSHGASKAEIVKNSLAQIKTIHESGMISDLVDYVNDHQAELDAIKESVKNRK